MNPNVVHQYYKKTLGEFTILVRVDPVTFDGLELIVHKNGEIQKTERTFDEEIYEDLDADEFEEASPLEFNLYLKGLVK
ncbi:hypothetical protein QQ008_00640 [Fulvivirgaceae bacterium BMA10]|uniref:Uncharacterized protein n=1 Tax=Splendidivirga corallicola TaxID=3051826 RepID=A0ABT8KGJ5_9BACT|nr:hypothetical protein [Fulvivirgaceae bacterium BMA10]